MLMIIMTKIDHKPFLDLIKKKKTKQYKKIIKKVIKIGQIKADLLLPGLAIEIMMKILLMKGFYQVNLSLLFRFLK